MSLKSMLLLTNIRNSGILSTSIEEQIKVQLQPAEVQQTIGNPVQFRNGTATVSAEVLLR